jgi:hypothetical protein
MNNDKSHIYDFQIKALDKLVNSGIIKNIYPMIDNIEVDVVNLDYASPSPRLPWGTKSIVNLKIFINDPTITSENIWDSEDFDPFYLCDKYLRELLPYIGIDNNTTIIRFEVYSPEMRLVYKG